MNTLLVASLGIAFLIAVIIFVLVSQRSKKKKLEIKNLKEKQQQQKPARRRYSPGNPQGILIDDENEIKKNVKVRPRVLPKTLQDDGKIREDAVLDILGSQNTSDIDVLKQSLDFYGNDDQIEILNINRAEEKVPTVLIVDDSPSSLKSAVRALEKNYNIIKAEDGIDALDKMKEQKPDLVVTDVDMPRLDGLQMVTIMKESLILSDIPVIVVTGNVELHFKIGVHEGVDSFLPKPYSSEDLLEQAKFLLQR